MILFWCGLRKSLVLVRMWVPNPTSKFADTKSEMRRRLAIDYLPPLQPLHNPHHPWKCCALPRSYSVHLCCVYSGTGVTTPRLCCAWHRCSTWKDTITMEGSGGVECITLGSESYMAAWGGWMVVWRVRRGWKMFWLLNGRRGEARWL